MAQTPLPLSCRCLNPQRIVNPYTGEMMIVPCGRCQACILQKNSRLTFQCDLEATCNKYCVFITLTYANRYIPRASFVDCIDRPFGCDLIDKETGELLGPCDMLEEQREALLKKFYLFGDVPYLRKSDLQLFFKRFRYYAGKITKEKVRYFAVGEYGPVHFRPHFHILLYFSSEALLQACSEIVLASWKFGRVDCELSKGKCSSYVASYVNSSCTVPKVFTLPTTRPFCLHSQKLGQGFLLREREKIYSLSARDFIQRSAIINGKYVEFNLWRSCYRYFFPRCKGYANKSTCELSYSYRLYNKAKELFPECETAMSLAREIASFIRLFGKDTYSYGVSEKDYKDIAEYFYDHSCVDADLDSDLFQKWVNRIYIELLISKHFLYYVCDNQTTTEVKRKIKSIQEFYSQLDYMHLLDFFDSQCQYYESDFSGDEPLMSNEYGNSFCPYFYDNITYSISGVKHLKAFKIFDSEVYKQASERIKHKLLNDKNKIFIYG